MHNLQFITYEVLETSTFLDAPPYHSNWRYPLLANYILFDKYARTSSHEDYQGV